MQVPFAACCVQFPTTFFSSAKILFQVVRILHKFPSSHPFWLYSFSQELRSLLHSRIEFNLVYTMSARESSVVLCWQAASVSRLRGSTSTSLCLVDISACPPNTSLNRTWPSLPGRCVERSVTASRSLSFTSVCPSVRPQSPVRPIPSVINVQHPCSATVDSVVAVFIRVLRNDKPSSVCHLFCFFRDSSFPKVAVYSTPAAPRNERVGRCVCISKRDNSAKS